MSTERPQRRIRGGEFTRLGVVDLRVSPPNTFSMEADRKDFGVGFRAYRSHFTPSKADPRE